MSTQGLETAWHCLRAGRSEEGIPYLINGASQAIHQGAPHEAERALRTGLPIIPDDRKAEAIILLATALQEQAAWQELLSALDTLPDQTRENVRYEAVTLAIRARRGAGELDAHEIQNDLDTLVQVVRSSQAQAIRARAIGVAAMLTNSTRARGQTRLIYTLSGSAGEAELQAPDRAELSRAKAILAYQLGDSQASLKHLEAALALIAATGLASSIAVSVYTGLGVHACLQGRYEEAIEHHDIALQASVRLGNDAMTGVCCGNLAVCFGRLGSPKDQLTWAERALSLQGS